MPRKTRVDPNFGQVLCSATTTFHRPDPNTPLEIRPLKGFIYRQQCQ
jgi:hypothetical protein